MTQLIALLLDLPAIAAGAVVILTGIRASRLYNLLTSLECPSAPSRRAAAYVQFIALIADLICFVLGAGLLLPTVYRLPSTRRAITRTRVLRNIQRDARVAAALAAGRDLSNEEYSLLNNLGNTLVVHRAVVWQCVGVLVDLPFLAMGAVVSCCLWRTVILWRALLAVRDEAGNAEIELYPARVRRRIAAINFIKVRLAIFSVVAENYVADCC